MNKRRCSHGAAPSAFAAVAHHTHTPLPSTSASTITTHTTTTTSSSFTSSSSSCCSTSSFFSPTSPRTRGHRQQQHHHHHQEQQHADADSDYSPFSSSPSSSRQRLLEDPVRALLATHHFLPPSLPPSPLPLSSMKAFMDRFNLHLPPKPSLSPASPPSPEERVKREDYVNFLRHLATVEVPRGGEVEGGGEGGWTTTALEAFGARQQQQLMMLQQQRGGGREGATVGAAAGGAVLHFGSPLPKRGMLAKKRGRPHKTVERTAAAAAASVEQQAARTTSDAEFLALLASATTTTATAGGTSSSLRPSSLTFTGLSVEAPPYVLGAAGVPSTCTNSTLSMTPSSPGASLPSSSPPSSSSPASPSSYTSSSASCPNGNSMVDAALRTVCGEGESGREGGLGSSSSSSGLFSPSSFFASSSSSHHHHHFTGSFNSGPSLMSDGGLGLGASTTLSSLPSSLSLSPRGLTLSVAALLASAAGAGGGGREGGMVDESDAFFASPSPRPSPRG